MDFHQFLENEEKKNIKTTLGHIPSKHRALVKGYNFKLQSGNTMSGDDENIGQIDTAKKCITIAAPWHYGREFTLLHEIGHMVWAVLPHEVKTKWQTLVKKLKCDPKKEVQNQSVEELFCMAYANTYAKHKDKIHDHPEWDKFIRAI